MGIAFTIGRIFIPIFFVVAGIQNAMNIGELSKMVADTNIPIPDQIVPYLAGIPKYDALAYLFVAIEIICGLLILAGLKARWAALILVVYTACSIFFIHHFWDGMSGADMIMHRTEALKDLSIIGGLLLVVAVGSGPAALDRDRN